MKKQLYIFSSILLIFSISRGAVFASIDNCTGKSGFPLYECQVKEVCKAEFKPENTRIYTQAKDYEAFEIPQGNTDENIGISYIDTAKETYRENIGNIYKCAVIQAQKNSLEYMKNTLFKIDKTGELKDRLGNQVQTQLSRLQITSQTLSCSTKKPTGVFLKKDILDEATFEMCRYQYYLNYLSNYSDSVEFIFGIDANSVTTEAQRNIRYPITTVIEKQKYISGIINEEVEHTYRVFSLAFQAYAEYENHYLTHILLEMVRGDFIVFRDSLQATLNPINQVVYKISNAMSY